MRAVSCLLAVAVISGSVLSAADRDVIPYDTFSKSKTCGACHVDIARQHEQSMMSQAFTHHWDEIEYFELAVPNADQDPRVAEIKAGCNGCHAPLSFLAGDIPPPRPSENSRANEGVSCHVCHSITGFEGDTPYNFNWTIEPGKTVQGTRGGGETPFHEIKVNPFLGTSEFCGTCHNEKSPFGAWVKATQLEWKESPHAKAGIVCQDCHMPPAPGTSAKRGRELPDVRQHLFHGAHDANKLTGSVEVRIHPERTVVKPGSETILTAIVVNAKAGHMIPSGSAEERVLWLHVEAKDSQGGVHHLKVDKKGFEGEPYTIASSTTLAYQDVGEIKGVDDFKGLPRDGMVPDGDRIFRLPYLDPEGRMTIAQWNTASFGPDYRLAPLKAKRETYTWTIPETLEGEVVVTATVYYSRLVSSVAKYLGVPEEEWAPVTVGTHVTHLTIKP